MEFVLNVLMALIPTPKNGMLIGLKRLATSI
jgi:hypothetical protein